MTQLFATIPDVNITIPQKYSAAGTNIIHFTFKDNVIVNVSNS